MSGAGPCVGSTFRRFLIPLVLLVCGCGESATDRLLRDLQSPDAKTRQSAAQAIVDQKLADPRFVPILQRTAADSAPDVRRWSCRALGTLNDRSVLPTLEGRLKDEETAVRRAAALALLTLAPDNQPAKDELTQAMQSGDGGVIVLLTGWTPAPTWATPTLLGLIKDRRPGIHRLAVEALGVLGRAETTVGPALQRLANDPDDRVREAVSRARGQRQSHP